MTTVYSTRSSSIKTPSKPVVANIINHVTLVVDGSGSMRHLVDAVVKVVDQNVRQLADLSKQLDQETRLTVYRFSGKTEFECIYFDKDALRTPTIAGRYHATNQTALIDATLHAINDLETTSQLYGDHSFLMYVITDGQENDSRTGASALRTKLESLPENWTYAVLVPNKFAIAEAQKYGFPSDNIAVWDATSVKGVEAAGSTMMNATTAFMQQRAVGVRGTRKLFDLTSQVEHLNTTVLKQAAAPLHFGQYRFWEVKQPDPNDSMYSDFPLAKLNKYGKIEISAFVEHYLQRPYRLGEAYYQLVKPEKIQAGKAIAIYDRKTHQVYASHEARQLLGLPDVEITVSPTSNAKYDIFVQSTSTNRVLPDGTRLLVLS